MFKNVEIMTLDFLGDFTMATSFRLNNLMTVDDFDAVMDAGAVATLRINAGIPRNRGVNPLATGSRDKPARYG